jgi:alkanesulfonate monooxygenase SsuD/methylene tetrahydromethanopterin reductase-like flavin-dependent oxidoreductase (luciferase family)
MIPAVRRGRGHGGDPGPREEITFDYLDQRQMVINGDPDKCVRNIKSFQEAGVDLLLCMMQGHGVSHSDVMESIRLFGQHVISKFH